MTLPDLDDFSPDELRALTDTDLQHLLGEVYAEVQRRQTLAAAPAEAEALAHRYAEAIGREDGDEWAAPSGAHNAYPQGAIVTHDGKQWESLTPANVWAPGISGWRELTADDGPPPEWVAPSGAHDAYGTGDRVTYQGDTYESLIDGNVWSPDSNPAGWEKI